MMLREGLRTWPRDAGRWLRHAWTKARSQGAIRVLLWICVGTAVLCAVAPALVADHLERLGILFPYYGGDTARITVEIPAIHTRERLINDRNEQVAWIEEELKRTLDQSPFPPDPQAGKTPERSPAPGGQATATESGPGQLRSEWSSGVNLADRPLDRFKELNAFREVVRTERAHAMLDDRHDLDGNTLYFLSFDATVLPGRKSRGYAVVSAWLSQPPEAWLPRLSSPEKWFSSPPAPDPSQVRSLGIGAVDAVRRIQEMRLKDEFEVYLDWLDRVRLRMEDAVTATTAELSLPDVRINVTSADKIGPLEMRLCQRMVLAPDKLDAVATEARSAARAACRRALRRDGSKAAVGEAMLTSAETARDRVRKAEDDAARSLGVMFEANYYEGLAKAVPGLQQYVGGLLQTQGQRLSESDRQLLRAISKGPAAFFPTYSDAVGTCASRKPEESSGGMPIPALDNLARTMAAVAEQPPQLPSSRTERPRAEVQSFPLPCPYYATVPDTLRVLALIEDALERDPQLGTKDLSLRITQRSSDRGEELRARAGAISKGALDLVREKIPVPSLSLYEGDARWVPLNDMSPSCLAARIESQRFMEGAPGVLGDRGHSFGEFFDAEIVRRGDDCYVDVLQTRFWSETPEGNAAAEVRTAKAPGAGDDGAAKWARFQTMLEAATGATAEAQPAAYSYGLSPRLRRGFTSEQATNAGVGLSVSGYGAETRDTQQFSGTLYDPEIVGFTPRAADGTDEQARAAGFGWIIGPRREGAGAGWRRLAVEQAQLGAFVAVPSWWRTVLLRVCTGFATERELPQAPDWWASDRASAGHEPGTSCRVHALRLPGTAAEFDRRLGMQVVRFPYIRTRRQNETPQELIAGKPGSLLLEGGRLWRSTEVTVGAQRATRIRVLPNMEAIIAEFSCIDRPTTFIGRDTGKLSEGYQTYIVPVHVWTSEGTTKQDLRVNVLVPQAAAERHDCEKLETTPAPASAGGAGRAASLVGVEASRRP